jgi:hypothetical protein
MLRQIAALLALIAGSTASVQAQAVPELRVAAPVTGRMHADSGQITYRFTASAGDRLRFSMRSDSFDTVVEVGRMRGGEWASEGVNDDFEGTNSRLSVVIDSAGEYRVLAKPYEEGSEGPFTLEMTSESDPTCCAPTLSTAVDHGGILADDDRAAETGARFDPYLISARAGQELVVTMRSSAFAPRVRVGRWTGGAFLELGAGSGTGGESRVSFRFPADGEYLVMASAVDATARGGYRIVVDPAATAR